MLSDRFPRGVAYATTPFLDLVLGKSIAACKLGDNWLVTARPSMTQPDSKLGAIRAFLRTLNMLLKCVRMYGMDHVHSTEQMAGTWSDLHKCLEAEGGFQIAVTGAKLLIDSKALKANPAEAGFASLLSSAGISSIQFSRAATRDEFGRFARAFAQSGGKFEGLLDLLRKALPPGSGIRVNEVRFVEADSAGVAGTAEARIVGEFAAQALGGEAGVLRDAVTNPRKLLALIAAAEANVEYDGSEATGSGGGFGAGVGGGGTGAPGQPDPFTDVDLQSALHFLGRLSDTHGKTANPHLSAEVQTVARNLPVATQESLRLALASLLEEDPNATNNPNLLIQLAERLAIQYALRKFEKGGSRVDAVREMLGKMAREIDSLRKRLALQEEKAPGTSQPAEVQAAVLEQDFWGALSYEARRRALLSPDAWTFPLKYVRHFIEDASARRDASAVADVLSHYAAGVRATNVSTRQAAVEGIAELAESYPAAEAGTLEFAVTQVGEQLSVETDTHLQTHLGTVFVRFAQLAAETSHYEALKQVLICLRLLIHRQPSLASGLQPRIGLEKRVADLMEEALTRPAARESLLEVLKEIPNAAIRYASAQFSQATQKERAEQLIALASELGPEATQALRETLTSGPDSEAISTVGMLTRLEIGAVGEQLRARLPRWNHSYQNLVVRQIASSGAPGRGRLLEHIFDLLDPLVLPPAIDEIGMSGDVEAAGRLLRLAAGELPQHGSPYLILKAIEALGRLRAESAIPILKRYAEEKRLWMWVHPHEVRIVACQSLRKIDPAWEEKFLPQSGLSEAELALEPLDSAGRTPGVRQRGYPRVQVRQRIAFNLTAAGKESPLLLKDASLGGFLAAGEVRLPAGTRAEIEMGSGGAAIHAVVLVRGVRKNGISLEIVDIEFEERSKLRKLLLEMQK